MCVHCVCVKVLDWIENHGEAFLSKHTGVGKSLHRARALQKRHEDFEEVAQVRFKHKQTQAYLYVATVSPFNEKSQHCPIIFYFFFRNSRNHLYHLFVMFSSLSKLT